MKLVIIGGTGLIGSKLVTKLTVDGHEAVPASPGTRSLLPAGDARVGQILFQEWLGQPVPQQRR